MSCGRWGQPDDVACVWCSSPLFEHWEVECSVCLGWGRVDGWDGERAGCGQCQGGVVVNQFWREAA